MKKTVTIFALFLLTYQSLFSQTYPTYGNEIPVIINGLSFDAMEPSISADGNYLFFNSLNDGITTSLYYALRINDSTFTYMGPLSGANQTVSPRLDAVASTDSANHFFWVSTRDYPTQFDNYFHGTFDGTNVINTGRLHGTFYVYLPGWLIMDAVINYSGDKLYYCNAYFNGCGALPCQTKLGIAQKQNDSTFNKILNSDAILQNINDTNYLVYAPFISKNGLELYYTRILKSNPLQTEICVAVRSSQIDNFSLPSIIYSSPLLPEAPTLTTNLSQLYYHKKEGNLYKIFMRYRNAAIAIETQTATDWIRIFPNPSHDHITIALSHPNESYSIEIHSMDGKQVLKEFNKPTINISTLINGFYLLTIQQGDKIYTNKIVKQ